jgi:hypothetical protein
LRAAYAEALDKLREATAVLRWAPSGPQFRDALEKLSNLAPGIAPLGGRSKAIAKHTAANGFGSYVPF